MISEERLRLALEEYDEALMAALPDPGECNHRFSPRFEQKMRKLFRRAKHPVAYKTLQRAACVLLALLALFGGIIAFNPDVRAAVVDWVREQFGHFSHYYSPEDPSDATSPSAPAERKQYELGWLPEGYVLLDSVPGEDRESLLYFGGAGQMIQLHYIYKASDGAFFDETNCFKKSVSVDNFVGDLYLSQDPQNASGIVWVDSESGVLFCIAATTDEETLMQLAFGVIEKK